MKKLLAIILAITLTLTLFASCGAVDKAFVSSYLNLGEKYLTDLDYEQAIVYFNKVIEVEPRNERAYLGAAEAYEALGDTESAINILKTALEVFTDDEDVTTELLEMLIEIDPTTAEWYLRLAQIYIDRGDTDKAVEVLEDGMNNASDTADIGALLAELLPEEEPEEDDVQEDVENEVNESSMGSYDNTSSISITVWCPEAAVDLTASQLAAYNEANGTSINFTVEAVGEGDAATYMIADVTDGADIYFFAQDQLARLVQAGALTHVSSALTDTITEENFAGAVAAATVGRSLYAFPLTTDNGYFVYYDKSVITDESVLEDQTALIEAVSAAGKTIAFELTDSGWYSAAYFFATGCESEWSIDGDGNFIGYFDTYNSESGIIACKGMAELINSGVFVNSSSTASFLSGSAIVVSGTWDYTTAYRALGDNLGCAELWNFTVDGETYHLGSYSGNKLIGIKPQTDPTKAAYCQSVAMYLSGESCQQERFETLAWGPSNVNVQASEAVQENIALSALLAQSEYATPQSQYPNSWWDASKEIGASIQKLRTTSLSDYAIQTILDAYTVDIERILQYSSTSYWVIVGDMDVSWSCTGGSNGEYILTNNLVDSDDPYVGIWEYDITVVGRYGFRVVMYGAWDAGDYDPVGIGYTYLTEGSVGTEGVDNNIVVDPGSYHVTLDTTGDTPAISVIAN